MSGSFGEQEMSWEHEPTSKCFHSFFKFSQTSMSVSIYKDDTSYRENMFCISFRRFCDKEEKTPCVL